jgi:hypothetical protein
MQSEQLYAVTYVTIGFIKTHTKTVKDLTFEQLQAEIKRILEAFADSGVQISVTQTWN